MKIIDIKETEKTPKIILDDSTNTFEMSGRSNPENIRNFYLPVVRSLEIYLKSLVNREKFTNEDNTFKLKFKMGYFNSASAKFIADIMLMMNDYIKNGCDIKIYWYFLENDEDMHEAGEDFAEMLDVPLNYVMIPFKE